MSILYLEQDENDWQACDYIEYDYDANHRPCSYRICVHSDGLGHIGEHRISITFDIMNENDDVENETPS